MCRCGNMIIRNPANLIYGVFGFTILVHLLELKFREMKLLGLKAILQKITK